MRTERIVWIAIGLAELIAILGAVLVNFLPEGMKIVGWVILVVLGGAVVCAGFVFISRGNDHDGGRYIWSKTR